MADICQNCGKRPATVNWTSEGGVLAFVHGMYQRWCDLCATTAQLDHARAMAAQIPELEAKLASIGSASSGS